MDEKTGVTRASNVDPADWYSQVKSWFNELSLPLLYLNIPVKGKIVVALYLETDKAPFIVRIPAFGSTKGEGVSLEVPWRENTSTRSATRAELLRLLSPLEDLPTFELLKVNLRSQRHTANKPGSKEELNWTASIYLYSEVKGSSNLVIPFHRCRASFEEAGYVGLLDCKRINIQGSYTRGGPSESPSRTIKSTSNEILVRGPSVININAYASTPILEGGPTKDAHLKITLAPIHVEHPIFLNFDLP